MPLDLAELLLREGVMTQRQHEEAVSQQQRVGGSLQRALVNLGFVRDEDIRRLFSRLYAVPYVDLKEVEIDPAIPSMITGQTAWSYKVLPLSRSRRTLTVAMADPTNVWAVDDLAFLTGHSIQLVVASERALEDAITRHYGASFRRLKQKTPSEVLQEDEALKPLAQKYGCRSVNLYQFEIEPQILTIAGYRVFEYLVLPLSHTGAVLTVAMADPSNVRAIDEIARRTGCGIEPVVASERALREMIYHYYGDPDAAVGYADETPHSPGSSPTGSG